MLVDSSEAVFDPRLGGRGQHGVVGSKYRDPKTGWFVPSPEKKSPDAIGMKEITFKCKFCGKNKPVDELRILTRFFPRLVACRECEKGVG
ncbi:MAG: hypothetical protein Q8P31_12875 [Bacillota bacterium]|nr:hypothetical protein [Bacillota bacterium]